jgi:hypothetical protein
MADYAHPRPKGLAAASAAKGHLGHVGLIGAVVVLILAGVAWLWLRQAPGERLPAPSPAAIGPAHVAHVPVLAPAKITPPPSLAEAEAGDTRAAKP